MGHPLEFLYKYPEFYPLSQAFERINFFRIIMPIFSDQLHITRLCKYRRYCCHKKFCNDRTCEHVIDVFAPRLIVSSPFANEPLRSWVTRQSFPHKQKQRDTKANHRSAWKSAISATRKSFCFTYWLAIS